jgi:ATP-binding cassette subfamily B protein
MACAIVVSATTLAIPLCIRSITKNLENNSPNLLHQIYMMGGLMLALIAIHTISRAFVDYKGHMMGAMMEKDMRSELFQHYQKLSFKFYDENRTGQLMTRISQDTFDLGELYHHGPEDIVFSLLNFLGAIVILTSINVKLGMLSLLFIPIMGIYGFYFSKKMYRALRKKVAIGLEILTLRLKIHLPASGSCNHTQMNLLKQKNFIMKTSTFLQAEKMGIRMKCIFIMGCSHSLNS